MRFSVGSPILGLALAGALMLLSLPGSAQHLWPGYAVLLQGDSVQGAVRVSSSQQQQTRIKFVPLSGSQALMLRPEQVRAYGYIKGRDTLRYVACSFPVGTASSYTKTVNGQNQVVHEMAVLVVRMFLRQLVAGPVQLYERNVVNGGRGSSTSRIELLLCRRGQPMVNTYWWNFSKNAASFFSDNTALVADIQHGRYRPRDLPLIVQRYNREQNNARFPAR